MEGNYSYMLNRTGPGFGVCVTPYEELDPMQFSPTDMDRTKVSSSSTQTRQSMSSAPGPSYVVSPPSSPDSPPTDRSFQNYKSNTVEQSANNPLSSAPLSSCEPRVVLPLFDIEQDGDPDIHWLMYYDFEVTKTEAYYQLQPGYLATLTYPFRIQSEKVILPNGENRHPCRMLNCNAKPFTRHYDLERHFSTVHKDIQRQSSQEQRGKDHEDSKNGEKVHMNCDYKRCSHTAAFRKDHCREHYREFHLEDLIKRGPPKSSKHSKKKPQSVQEFMVSRIENLPLTWWRCSKCVQRVYLDPNRYTCPTCKQTCEKERIDWRENARNNRTSNYTKKSKHAGSTLAPVFGCGQCENLWVRDEDNEGLWLSCQQCRPGSKDTARL